MENSVRIYSPKNPAQSAYQALAGLRGRMAALLDEVGLSEKVSIENYLKPALDAQETIFAQVDGRFTSSTDLTPTDPKEAARYGVRVIHRD